MDELGVFTPDPRYRAGCAAVHAQKQGVTHAPRASRQVFVLAQIVEGCHPRGQGWNVPGVALLWPLVGALRAKTRPRAHDYAPRANAAADYAPTRKTRVAPRAQGQPMNASGEMAGGAVRGVLSTTTAHYGTRGGPVPVVADASKN